MPIYEYECESCYHTLEALQKVNDTPLINCPSCKKSTLKKKISAVRFRLKGSGWYETDFKTGNKKNLVGSEGSSSSSDSSSGKQDTTVPKNASSDSSPTKPSTTATS